MTFTDNAKLAIEYAEQLALVSGGIVGTEHLLGGILYAKESDGARLLREAGLSLEIIQKSVQRTAKMQKAVLSERTKKVFRDAENITLQTDSYQVDTLHLLLAIMQDSSSYAVKLMTGYGIKLDLLFEQIKQILLGEQYVGDESSVPSGFEDVDAQVGEQTAGKIKNETGIPELNGLGCDLTQKAKLGKLDPIIGRSKEIDRVIQVLSRRTKNNPVLIGEPGVGKTAIIEGLAQAVVQGNVPEMLKDKKIFSLEMASVVAGTKYRGEFEKRLQDAIAAIKKAGDVIIFIDEIHTIVGSGGSEGAVDAANILKPMLARGELQTIGATTIEEYRKHIEKDSALERRFQPIVVDPPSVEDTICILKGLREKYESHHKVSISGEAIEAAAVLSDRYISDRFLPDKAIDLIDEACSKKRISSLILPQNLKEMEDKINRLEIDKKEASKREDFQRAAKFKAEQDSLITQLNQAKAVWENTKTTIDLTIGANEIAEIVSAWTSIPVVQLTEAESQRLLSLETVLGERVIGQKEAVNGVSRAVRRARAGLKDPNRPIGSFIFLGPTGVGKTELCKALAEAMFGDENLMIRFDMSEYMDKVNVSKLIGSAPGYVGFEDGGQLTEKARRKPYSVVLFDEIEKAHPDVFNLLLQILEDGRLTDSHGRTVSFKNTIIIMTSNIGASEIGSLPPLGFGGGGAKASDYEKMKERQLDALKKAMRPEFINRIDEIIIFHKLERDEVEKIAKLLIAKLQKRLSEKNINISLCEAAEKFIIDQGYDQEYGARPLRRAVQRLLEDELSEEILRGNIVLGENVFVGFDGSKLTFSKTKPQDEDTTGKADNLVLDGIKTKENDGTTGITPKENDGTTDITPKENDGTTDITPKENDDKLQE